jgi:magnesium chelatase family protein
MTLPWVNCDAFVLIVATDPRFLGSVSDPVSQCRCVASAIACYLKRISFPLQDRINIQLDAPQTEYHELPDRRIGEPSATARARDEAAPARQTERLANTTLVTSCDMYGLVLLPYAVPEPAAE